MKAEFGFKAGVSGAHTARTMMLADLTTLLAAAPMEAKREDFNRLIVEENVLGKRTTSNRDDTYDPTGWFNFGLAGLGCADFLQ